MPTEPSTRSIDTLMMPTQESLLLLQLVESKGVKPVTVLQGTGLTMADLESDDVWISYRQTMQIVHNCLEATDCATLGLELGAAQDISTFGILGYAMLSCATLGEALSVGVKYQRTAQNLSDVRLDMDEKLFAISAVAPFVLDPSGYRFAIEELFAGVMAMSRIITGEELYPTVIRCAYADPGYRDKYECIFRCPIHFDEPGNRMEIELSVLDLPVLQANKFNARMSEKLCEDVLQKHIGEQDLSMRIRHIILREPGKFPDEIAVAQALAMSGRTLRRRLSDLGTSYRTLLDQVRADLAEQYLLNSQLSVEQVGLLLGYTESTNFRRAFKRWLGVAPREYRERKLRM